MEQKTKKTKEIRVYTLRISTTVSIDLMQKRLDFNKDKPKNERIEWAECIRRGFNSLWAEKNNIDIADILDSDYVPISVKERVRELSKKFVEAAKQLDLLKPTSGIGDITEGKHGKSSDPLSDRKNKKRTVVKHS